MPFSDIGMNARAKNQNKDTKRDAVRLNSLFFIQYSWVLISLVKNQIESMRYLAIFIKSLILLSLENKKTCPNLNELTSFSFLFNQLLRARKVRNVPEVPSTRVTRGM